MTDILRTAEDVARQNNSSRILKLKIRVGAISGVVTEALQFAFEALKKGTIAEDAELEIEVVPARCLCKECQTEYEPGEVDFLCPNCGSPNIKLQNGRELDLISIDFL